jgi:alpha-beta hydrolase superfamily lysophospholipase
MEFTLSMSDGTALFGIKDIPENPKAAVVIVHGVAEHCGRYGYTAETLYKRGYAVYRYDNRGHGRSGGARGYVKSFMDFIRDADMVVQTVKRENPGLPVFILGHSMGGFIAAAYGAEYPDSPDGEILSGASVIELPLREVRLLKSLPYRILGGLKVKNNLGALVSRDAAVVEAYGKDEYNLTKTTLRLNGELFIKGTAWLSENIGRFKSPCLILHGGEDKIVTPAAGEWLFENISSRDKEKKVYPGLYHEILNEKEKEEVLSDICGWLDRHAAEPADKRL